MHVILNDNAKNENGHSRFSKVTKLCMKSKFCGDLNENGCGAPRPSTIKKETGNLCNIYVEWKTNKEKKTYNFISNRC